MKMEESILGNIKNVDMVKVFLVSLIVILIWDLGKRINLMVMDCIYMLMGKSIKESLLMGKKLVEELIIIKVGLSFKVNGKKIRKMASVYFSILITKNMKEIG